MNDQKIAGKVYCSEDISLIENYDKAKNDNTQVWVIHHRLETHKYKDRKREEWIERDESVPQKELKALGLYYNRPAKELIFMTRPDHQKLHNRLLYSSVEAREYMAKQLLGKNKGKTHTEEEKIKMREAWQLRHEQGYVSPNRGRHMSEEQKRKISEAKRGKPRPPVSEETRRKLSEQARRAAIGRHYYNNGVRNIRTYSCPEGFVPGRIK